MTRKHCTRRQLRATTQETTTEASMATIDEATGEVKDEAPRRRALTPDERAERDRVLTERTELRRQELAALRTINPAGETADDPPVVWRRPARMGGEPSGVLLDLPRMSGRGLPGSRLVLAARGYDGAGPNGGQAHDYATGFVIFRDGAGYEWRTIGVAIRRAELRPFSAALTRYADELDARETKGTP
jgi:hypothetical protein